MHLICPECRTDGVTGSWSFLTGQYRCSNCGYVGSFVIEMDDENYQKYREEQQDSKSED
ncbi:MAG: hypothetical protein M1267_04830 [Candidatus Thermoplasmatota archaeon]|jgi:phage-related protein|nr:hypothetical protein [Candidatus Thermoplasmatota archaeon]MCL5799907.1 hypothetical protein [Candidatus Thermoplasmatota archaeon]